MTHCQKQTLSMLSSNQKKAEGLLIIMPLQDCMQSTWALTTMQPLQMPSSLSSALPLQPIAGNLLWLGGTPGHQFAYHPSWFDSVDVWLYSIASYVVRCKPTQFNKQAACNTGSAPWYVLLFLHTTCLKIAVASTLIEPSQMGPSLQLH